jgi:hypothetical protein
VVVRGRWRRLALGSGGWRARRLEDNGGNRVVDDDDDGSADWEGDDETSCVRSSIPDAGVRPRRPLPHCAEDGGREGGHRMSHTRPRRPSSPAPAAPPLRDAPATKK